MDIARQFGMYIIPAPATKLSNALEIATNTSDIAADSWGMDHAEEVAVFDSINNAD